MLSATLIGGCVAAVALASWFGVSQANIAADADLARLLRGMALIKAGLAALAVALLLWRFARPVSPRTAAAYLVGTWLLAGASMLIWQLAFIAAAAVAFHIGELGLLLAAWHDRRALRSEKAGAVFHSQLFTHA